MPSMHFSADLERRFGGVRRLYGESAFARFQSAHVGVIGIGGVGSWAAEALARSAVGQITLIDLDMVAESNVNRQIHALDESLGQAKVEAMAERIRAINPACRIESIEEHVSPENLERLLATDFDHIIDAIDQVRAKAALIAGCQARNIPLTTAGAAGGKIDPAHITRADLSRTVQDPLLAKVRALLRKDYGFPRDPRKSFGILAVYSTEARHRPMTGDACARPPAQGGLSCAGYGSSVCVTASFGFLAAALALHGILATGPVKRASTSTLAIEPDA